MMHRNEFIVLYHFVVGYFFIHDMLLLLDVDFRVNSEEEYILLYYYNMEVNFQTH